MYFLYIFLAVTWVFHLNSSLGRSFSEVTGSPVFQIKNPASPPPPKPESNGGSDQKATAHSIQSPNVSLKLAFMADPRLFPYDIECDIQEKTVELTGVVSFEEEKILAALLTADLMRGKDILNHLEVRPALHGTLQATSDSRLTELVKQRFGRSQTLTDAKFEVITIRGIVSLRGQTRYQVIALEAAQAAREIPGVLAVNTQDIRIEGEND
jgi:hyperosmotically inducible protein